MLKTSTKTIEWNELFADIFVLNGNILQLNESVDGLNRYTLIINEDEIQDDEGDIDEGEDEEDEDTMNEGKLTNITKYFRNCILRRKIDKLPGRKYTDDYEYFEVDNGIDLYMSPYFENIIKRNSPNDDGFYEIPLKNFESGNPIFYIDISNDGLSAVLNDIIALVDKKEMLGCKTYTEVTNKFIELCNDSGIIINSVHLELVVRELVKDINDNLKRPDFSKVITENDYQLLRLSESILNSNSITTSISFERFKEQIYKSKTYLKKGNSLLDNFFM